MKCPACGLYQPIQFEFCLNCGYNMSSQGNQKSEVGTMGKRLVEPERHRDKSVENEDLQVYAAARPTGKPQNRGTRNPKERRTLPTLVGGLIAAAIFILSAGATIFFLTKAPDSERLFKQGQHELANGQYAFAVKTLNNAIASKSNEPKLYLALARAYIGVDQLDKAWDCIDHAQQLGLGVVAEPELASDLANYYRQRGQYEKAANLLRPLAKAHLPGKVAELSDLDALWGDDCLRDGNVDGALKCWEEVQQLKEGSRFIEADARLATIYQRLVANAISTGDDSKALDYLAKQNYIAQNPKNYELAASIYEGEEKFDLAIDQIHKAQKITPDDQELNIRLANLLLAYGKKLMNTGDSETGYAYIQQASSVNSSLQIPTVALRNLSVGIDPAFRLPRLSAEVWNPTGTSINALTVKGEFWDKANAKLLWSKEVRLIDEFVAPLAAKESKPFEFVATQPTKANGLSEFRIYLNGVLYDSYPIGKLAPGKQASLANSGTSSSVNAKGPEAQNIPKQSETAKRAPSLPEANDSSVSLTPEIHSTSTDHPKAAQEQSKQTSQNQGTPDAAGTPEEKTMKDLEF